MNDNNQRIASLDVLRGFGLLGILLMNISEFGLLSASYSYPAISPEQITGINLFTWASIDVLAEGSMRGIFSMLFGAGVLLFTTGENAKSAKLHFKRMFWLIMFGLFDAFILIWRGDILVNYAICGALIFFLRNKSATTLLVISATLMILMSAGHGVLHYIMSSNQAAWNLLQQSPDPSLLPLEVHQAAAAWQNFAAGFELTAAQIQNELHQRQDSYMSMFLWSAPIVVELLTFVNPLFLFWDSLILMTLGMALFKCGILQGMRSSAYYLKLMTAGFVVGLSTNIYEVTHAIQNDFQLLTAFHQSEVTYHLGRTGMAIGYTGLLIWLLKQGLFTRLFQYLGAVGKTALSNYLLQSFFGLIIFSGFGFGLVGYFERFELYGILILIWAFQLWISKLWVNNFSYGPAEWLWRTLTYGKRPA